MLLTLGALVIFHVYYLILGLPFIRIFHSKISLFGQVLAVGFFVNLSFFYNIGGFGYSPKDLISPFFLFFLFLTLLTLSNKKNWGLFKDLLEDSKQWLLGLLYFVTIFFFISFLFGFEAPFIFFHRSDSLYYVVLTDFFWDNTIYDIAHSFEDITHGSKEIMKRFSLSRTGLWHSVVPAYSLLGAHPFYYYAPLTFFFMNITSSVSSSCVRIFFPNLLKKTNFLTNISFYLVPFFVFIAFENYASHLVFIPYFILCLSLWEIMCGQLMSSFPRERLRNSVLMAFFIASMLSLYPEFIVLPVLGVLTLFFMTSFHFFKKEGFKKLKPYLVASVSILFFVVFFVFTLGLDSVWHGIEWGYTAAERKMGRYDILRQSFPNDISSYFLNLLGSSSYSIIMSDKLYNLSMVFSIAFLFYLKPNLYRIFNSRLGFVFFSTFTVFSIIQTYSGIKVLATWSVLITPLVYLVIKGRKKFLFLAFLFLNISYMISALDTYQNKKYIYSDFEDMERLRDYVVKAHKGEDLLFFVGNHIQSMSFSILFNRHVGKVFLTATGRVLRVYWGDVRGEKNGKFYNDRVLKDCSLIREKIIILKKSAQKFKHYKKLMPCLKQMPKKDFGTFLLLTNEKVSS